MALDLTNMLPKETLERKKPFTVCFTGPRPKYFYGYRDRRPYTEIVNYMTPLLRELADAGCTRFISGGAQGIDQLAFWSVNHVRKTHPDVENVLYLPFRNQPDRWVKEGMFGRDEYQLMLKKATGIRYISDMNPTSMPETMRKMTERNHAMVDDADLVFAVLRGPSLNWRTEKGGTAECVRYAASQGKNVLSVRYKEGPQAITTIQNIVMAQPAQARPRSHGHDVSDMLLRSDTNPAGPSCQR